MRCLGLGANGEYAVESDRLLHDLLRIDEALRACARACMRARASARAAQHLADDRVASLLNHVEHERSPAY